MKQHVHIGSIVTLVLAASAFVACGGDDGDDGDGPSGGGAAGESNAGGDSSVGGEGGGAAVDCTKRGPIDEDTTWQPEGACPDGFDVPSTIEVTGSGTTLTIEPGTKLKFQTEAELQIKDSAALVAVGTEAEPILFTGWQEAPGSWGGIVLYSSAVSNEISNAIVEYAGADDGASAAIALSSDDSGGRVKLTNTTIRANKQFGLTVLDGAELGAFENNTIEDNEAGAVRVAATAVDQLVGSGNVLDNNGDDNIVRIETSILLPLVVDTTWPNLSPAVYRVTGPGGEGGDDVYVNAQLTLEAGTVLELAGGSGFHVRGGTSGLSAIGTEEAPIIFRGVDGSGWKGIGYCESGWSGNRLEWVEVHNAKGPPEAWNLCGTGATEVLKPGILVGDNSGAASSLHIENLTVAGPNNADADIGWRSGAGHSTLTQAGTNVGTGAAGALVIEEF